MPKITTTETEWLRDIHKMLRLLGGILSSINSNTTAQLDAPTGLVATETDPGVEVSLAWDEVTNATGYIVERADDINFSTNLNSIYTGLLLVAVDDTVEATTEYFYRVRATGTNYKTSANNLTSITTT